MTEERVTEEVVVVTETQVTKPVVAGPGETVAVAGPEVVYPAAADATTTIIEVEDSAPRFTTGQAIVLALLLLLNLAVIILALLALTGRLSL
jgi:hypothetical protein